MDDFGLKLKSLLVSESGEEGGGEEGDEDDDDRRDEAVVLAGGEAHAFGQQSDGCLRRSVVAHHVCARLQNLDHFPHVLLFLGGAVDVVRRAVVRGDGAVDVTTASAERGVASACVASCAVGLSER